jgi:protein-S-isoprenylcysteine O-methyltransferase Ste14
LFAWDYWVLRKIITVFACVLVLALSFVGCQKEEAADRERHGNARFT